jgi:hypothetical protein
MKAPPERRKQLVTSPAHSVLGIPRPSFGAAFFMSKHVRRKETAETLAETKDEGVNLDAPVSRNGSGHRDQGSTKGRNRRKPAKGSWREEQAQETKRRAAGQAPRSAAAE